MVIPWQQVGSAWILDPVRPRAIVHFLGGAFIGALPQVVYSGVLEELAIAGYGVIATPYTTSPDHARIAQEVGKTFQATLQRQKWQGLPVFGLGHSLGCKLQILSCLQLPSLQAERQGNILMAYSNAGLMAAVPWGREIAAFVDQGSMPKPGGTWPFSSFSFPGSSPVAMEFDPSPARTNQLIETDYQVAPHLLIKFEQDTIDDQLVLHQQLKAKFGGSVQFQRLPGDHNTSVSRRYPFVASKSFSPLDALGQFCYQALNGDNQTLSRTLRHWLRQQLLSRSES